MYYFFTKPIDEESVLECVNTIEQYVSAGQKVTVWLNCGGGAVSYSKLLLLVLNSHSQMVTLIAGAGLYSAAFDVFYRFEGQRMMVEYCRGMIHYMTNEVVLNSHGKASTLEDGCILRNMGEGAQKEYEFARSILTEEELIDFEKGRDVYLPFKRMTEIFPEIPVIK